MLGFQPRSPPAHGKLRRAAAASMMQVRKTTVTCKTEPLSCKDSGRNNMFCLQRTPGPLLTCSQML